MPHVKDVRSLLVACVQDLYAAEQEAVDRYPPLIDAATGPDLKSALEAHRAQSREHAQRMQAVAELLGESAEGRECLWAKGILDDAKGDTKTVAPGPLLDVALVGGLRRLEQAAFGAPPAAPGSAAAAAGVWTPASSLAPRPTAERASAAAPNSPVYVNAVPQTVTGPLTGAHVWGEGDGFLLPSKPLTFRELNGSGVYQATFPSGAVGIEEVAQNACTELTAVLSALCEKGTKVDPITALSR